MGVIPNNNCFYIASNPAGANPSTNAINKQFTMNASNGICYSTNGFATGSDIRLKNIIENTSDLEAQTLLENIRIVNYTWKNDKTNEIQNGIIAQELKQILEENNIGDRGYLATTPLLKQKDENEIIEEENDEKDKPINEFEDYYIIKYAELVPILIKGWQIHEERIKQLEEENVLLKQIIKEKLNVDI